MEQDRRSFLAMLAGSFITVGVGHQLDDLGIFGRAPSTARLARIGIQIYTVRKQAAADMPATLDRLAQIGFKEVELAGFYNHPAAEVKRFLESAGLRAPSAHIAIEQIQNDPQKTFDDAHTIGQEWITVPSLPRGPHTTVDDWKGVADQFNKAAAAAKSAGFRFAFHNHNDIVKRTGDLLPIDILMKETDPALVNYQMDIYWAVSGGANPLDLLARYPGRLKMFHVKDGKPPYTDASQTDVGQGAIDFKPIFARGQGIEHYFVESDSAADPLAFAASAYSYLSNLEY